MALANRQVSYMPPRHLKAFEENLETLPLWFCDAHDFVLVRNSVPDSFIAHLERLGLPVPGFVTSPSGLHEQRLQSMRPWGWSAAAHHRLRDFRPFMDVAWNQNPMCRWNETHRELLSRLTGADICANVSDILKREPNQHIEIVDCPVRLNTLNEVESVTSVLQPPVLLKTPWSASGRGLFKIRDLNEQAHLNPWVISKLKQQGFLFAEPFLHKVQDLSFHFWCDEHGVDFKGVTWFKADISGQFSGCYINSPKINMLSNLPLDDIMSQAASVLGEALKRTQLSQKYHGPVGIDALFFMDDEGLLKLHPCIEANLRFTMGLLNLYLRRLVHPQSNGFWCLQNMSQPEWEQITSLYPLEARDGFPGKGALALTPTPDKQGYVAWLNLY
ncbi:hypothetical protein [Alkaliflexus imshenetskii]|uniref:hypothetical protein n=1 Tax=Alkaliflexus imshenetskii TaxID=286730 RepID=UPI0004AD7D49|nr:hypothetical protein [Alkaliflexus imshenetskii]